MRVGKAVFWASVGAGLTYIFDPVSGRSRRARLRDQLAARYRDALGTARTRATYQAGRLKGAIYETVLSGQDQPADDAELLQKIRSEAVGLVSGSTDHITIVVEEGHVTLKGMSEDPARERDLINRIEDVTGVRSVDNELVSSN